MLGTAVSCVINAQSFCKPLARGCTEQSLSSCMATIKHHQYSHVFADFAGMPKELLLEAVKMLEQQRKAKLFKGTSADDIGIKFFA